jgi:hypothetical protein
MDLYKGINYFKRSYQPNSNIAKDENCDLLADFPQHSEYVEELLSVSMLSPTRFTSAQTINLCVPFNISPT